MKNSIWIIFLALVTLLALWFIVKSTLAVVAYFHYSVQVPVHIEKWTVEEIKADQFALRAHYTYTFNDRVYQDSGWVGSRYPNPWAANQGLKQTEQVSREVWINPRHPEKSLIEKKFPYKKAFSAAIIVALCIYFIILGTYVKVRHGR